MAVLVKTCCFCCSLGTGATIVAILDLFASTYFIYHESTSVKDYKHLEENADDPSQDFPFRKMHFLAIKRLSYVNLALKVISFLVNLLLLASCSSDNAYLAYPWLGLNMFELFFNLGLITFLIAVWSRFAVFLIFYGIAWLLSIFSIVVVYSFIEDLRQKSPPPGNIGQQEAPLEMSTTATFQSNTHYPTRTSSRFSSTSARRQPKPSGSKLTTYIWSGGSEWGGGSEDCWGYSGGSGDWGYSGGSGGGDCGCSGADDGGGGGCGGGD